MQQCHLCEQLLQNSFLVFYRAHCMWLSKEWISSVPRENMGYCNSPEKRQVLWRLSRKEARSSWKTLGWTNQLKGGRGQTWSKSDGKSWDLIINWMQLFSAVEVLGEIASRTKLTISLIVSLSPFLQCRSLSQADSGSLFLMEPRVNCVSCLQTSSPEHRSLPMAIQLSNPCPHPHKTENGRGITSAENWS